MCAVHLVDEHDNGLEATAFEGPECRLHLVLATLSSFYSQVNDGGVLPDQLVRYCAEGLELTRHLRDVPAHRVTLVLEEKAFLVLGCRRVDNQHSETDLPRGRVLAPKFGGGFGFRFRLGLCHRLKVLLSSGLQVRHVLHAAPESTFTRFSKTLSLNPYRL